MLKKGILLSIVLMLLICSSADARRRRNIVVPTWYGYGVVSPYITAYQPYQSYQPYAWPAYGYSGMYPTAPVSTVYAGAGVPAWNGSYWYYQASSLAVVANNLNVRSEPFVSGKKSASNVIGSLNTGEQVYVMGRQGNWYLVQSAYMPLRRGYVYGSYLRFYQSVQPASHYTAFYPVSLASAGW
ncbi:MAG: SH3 domain-containing protein [Candidatus Riflebacteria bacterium]|nr:SH3 domain-containing protein [Candidatus Riflebacteria bacterium]